MDAFTCKVYMFDKAPKKIRLLGDKEMQLEPAQHAIEFPGERSSFPVLPTANIGPTSS